MIPSSEPTGLGDTDNSSDLGNGESSYGYAVKGVEFTYLRIADIVQFSESAADGRTDDHVEVLYAIDKAKGADLLKALGLQTNATTVKNALETYVAASGGTAMPLTDAYGKTSAADLDLGLYLVVETAVPEQ